VITKSVAIAGVLLVFSYLVVPAVIAQMWSDSIRGRLLLGWIVAIVGSIAGIVWSFRFDYPTGPAVVVMLSLSLILSGVLYYLKNSPTRIRAAANILGIVVFAVLFFTGLSYFKKQGPASETTLSPVDLLLNELKEGEEAHQLDAVAHLGEMHDSRIVPALTELLQQTSSEQLIEAVVEALGKQRDPRAIPALQHAAQQPYDDFMKLTIARAQIGVGDRQGFQTLIHILRNEEAGFARQQAIELLAGHVPVKFGYNAEKSVGQNSAALKRIEDWWARKGSKLKWNAKAERFE
ncbi:MAG TPA: HEAT repeat domain-containing protein, partial [Acidobacteriota bacterium]|nr:HEAT repeat domain-containing protein [Acidobacteriota bacterium]